KQRFFCVGSCFARELEDALEEQGCIAETRRKSLELIQNRQDLFQRTPNAFGRPNAFLNRYNVASMALLLRDIKTEFLGDRILFGDEKKVDFHYTRFIQALPLALALERRKLLREMYRSALKESDIFVFTLGLCEAFREVDDDVFLNITP